jgi:hypothetical protein
MAQAKFPHDSAASSPMYGIKTTPPNICQVNQVPLQRWVNIVISVNGEGVDVYLDGKLVKTCLINKMLNPVGNIILAPNGGFDGWYANFKKWTTYKSPQEIWNIYRKGYRTFNLGLGNLSLNMSVYKGDVQKSSVTI